VLSTVYFKITDKIITLKGNQDEKSKKAYQKKVVCGASSVEFGQKNDCRRNVGVVFLACFLCFHHVQWERERTIIDEKIK
jgi:hypothetical protein